jgi:hypothetical protein
VVVVQMLYDASRDGFVPVCMTEMCKTSDSRDFCLESALHSGKDATSWDPVLRRPESREEGEEENLGGSAHYLLRRALATRERKSGVGGELLVLLWSQSDGCCGGGWNRVGLIMRM